MSFDNEFSTVRLLQNSSAETRGVDAFTLSVIKAERQMRKLITHLVFQYPCFSNDDIIALKEKLAENRRVYFNGMIVGFDAIYPVSVEHMIGDKYETLLSEISKATKHRNKIFHGQLTGQELSRQDLFFYVDRIMQWCELLSIAAQDKIGYDGFARNSFMKSIKTDIHDEFQEKIKSIDDYEKFITDNMQR